MASHLKQVVRRTLARVVVRTLFSYSAAELRSALRDVGIDERQTLLVHSTYRRTSGFTGTSTDVIEVLLQSIGPSGNLLMMSMPYPGSSQRYADSDPVFDVRRSPSINGLISEMFRRRPDVLRSGSPLHPVVAWGPLAAWLTADHDKSLYSCGKGSPFERFLTLDGMFLFYDAPFGSLTFMHYVEDRFRQRLPVDPYDPTPATIRVRDAAGREASVRQYFFSAAARDRRAFGRVEEALRADGRLRTKRIGNMRLMTVRARDVVECSRELIERGAGVYR